MAFLPEDFEIPTLVAGPRFRIRPITVHDAVKDYDAVMSTRERLWEQFGDVFGWPSANLTLEDGLIDVAWRQKEALLRRSFHYAVLNTDESRLLGAIYIDPARRSGADADVYYWVRESEAGSKLEKEIEEFAREWVSTTWPFKEVRFPGRDLTWDEWRELPPCDGPDADLSAFGVPDRPPPARRSDRPWRRLRS